MSPINDRLTLRVFPLPVRLTLAAFLIAVGCGYGSALVQVHFQDTRGGQLLPNRADMIRKFNGEQDAAKRVSTIERLIRTPEHEDAPFTGQGSMHRAFFEKSNEWRKTIKDRPEADVRRERDGERDALLAWIRGGLNRTDYDNDHMPRPAGDQPITQEFLNENGSVKIKALFTERCVRCHQPDGDDSKAAKFPLTTYEQIKGYSKVDTGAMSLPALAQSTHTHLLSFAMLFTLTGVIIGLSSYPCWLRVIVAPLVVTSQVAEIACWWLGRIEGPVGVTCAELVLVFGGIVGIGLVIQIILGLFDLFGAFGKIVLIFLLIAAGCGVAVLKLQVIDPQLSREAGGSAMRAPNAQLTFLRNVRASRALATAS
jgi:hypothetical protein